VSLPEGIEIIPVFSVYPSLWTLSWTALDRKSNGILNIALPLSFVISTNLESAIVRETSASPMAFAPDASQCAACVYVLLIADELDPQRPKFFQRREQVLGAPGESVEAPADHYVKLPLASIVHEFVQFGS